MPDSEAREGQGSPFSDWNSFSAEVVRYNIRVGTNIAEYWRQVAEIHIAAAIAIAVPRKSPPDRQRNFRIINGGKP
jgi:hypothetical protein